MDYKVIKTPGWEMHISEKGFRLLPPAAWILELTELLDNGTINSQGSKVCVEEWQKETLARIGLGIEKLINLGELKGIQEA